MAQTIPSNIPEVLESDPFRKAELSLYHASKTLSNKWWVLYGVSWYFIEKNISYEGEADFVFLSEESGIIVVEVKGGGICREDDCWYSVDRKGERHRIKNPVDQASKAKHQILGYLKQKPEFSQVYIPMTHMVCFPSVNRINLPSTIDMPKNIVLCADDFDCLSERLKIINVGDNRINSAQISAICKHLKPEFSCTTKYSVAAKKNLQIMERLTEEQNLIWDMLDDNQHVGLSGPAGSGKTILAMKKIQHEIENGGRVLILLPSRALAEYYKSMFSLEQVTVRNYNDVPPPLTSMGVQLGKLLQPNLVVIDEAQDLCEDAWLQFYESYNIEEVEKLLIVYDSNQKLKKKDSFYLPKNLVLFQLNSIIRNTQQIGRFSLGFYANSKEVKCLGPDGASVRFVESKSPEDDLSVAVKMIKQFVFEEGFDYKDIVVLTGRDGVNSRTFANAHEETVKNELGISFRSHEKSQLDALHKHPIIQIENLHGFRGLESNIVILVGLDIAKPEEIVPWCYIGASRARTALVIIATKPLLKKIDSEVRSVRIPTSRFHIDTGPASLFERVLFKFSNTESLLSQVQDYLNRGNAESVPQEVFDTLVRFDHSKMNLIMAEVRNDKGKFVSSIWTVKINDGIYWVEIGYNNAINSIIKPVYGKSSGVIKYGNLYNFVSEVNEKLMAEEKSRM